MLSTTKLISKCFFKNAKNKYIFNTNILKNLSSLSEFEEKKVQVDGIDINYVKTGVGEHIVLLLPGALGSVWTDFKPQVEKLDKKKLTLIAWDPPGYGKSRPPNRTFSEDFYERDATWACNLMKTLGYDKFSLIGWSDGGTTSLILAARYSENVRKMVVLGTNSYIAPSEIENYQKLRNISTWTEKMREPMIKVYGEEYFQKTWNDWMDCMIHIYNKNNGDICKADLAKIKSPTLIIYGQKDFFVLPEHLDYLKTNICNSRVEIFKSGAHNLHLRFSDEFNAMVEKFLIDEEK